MDKGVLQMTKNVNVICLFKHYFCCCCKIMTYIETSIEDALHKHIKISHVRIYMEMFSVR